jgi:phosphate/sulfate permease
MMWALLVGGVWQILASSMELNVSATHSIIGAIVGFSMVFKGKGAVVWAQEQLVCTGPMTGFNHDGRPQGKLMMFNGKPLAGTFTVPVGAIYNASTGAAMSTMNADLLTVLSGYPVLPHNVATWATPYAVAACAAGNCYNSTSAGGVPTPTSFSGNSGPYIVNLTDHPFGAVQFTLRTAGRPLKCGGASCPIAPTANSPIAPRQFYYTSTAGYCTTASNGKLPFPPYKGVLIIVLSWFFSPILTGVASAILFRLSRTLVLRSPHAYKRSFFVLPPMAFLTFWVNIYFVFTKGAAKVLSGEADGWTDVRAGWIAAVCAGGVAMLSIFFVIPLMHHRINTIYQLRDEAAIKEAAERDDLENAKAEPVVAADVDKADADGLDTIAVAADDAPQGRAAKLRAYMKRARDAAMHGMEVDVHAIVEEDELVAAIHANAEVFDEKAETVFSYMQVFSAICVIFAHGAGEVGYMSGPLGAIFSIIRSGSLSSSTSPPIWTVLVGALGLIIGLGTYGYSVTRAIGTRMAKLTASRGFAAELSTSMVIMIAAQYGLPTSSSQCITGGIIGIALCEGKGGLNVKFLFQTFMSWVWTVVFMALLTGFFFAQGAYAPSAQMARQVGYYEEALSARSNLILTSYQSMLKASGYIVDGSNKDQFATYLATTIANTASGQYYSYQQAPPGFYPGNKAPVVQTVAPWQMVGYLDTALALMQMSLKPDTSAGINMCNNGTAYTSTRFPWSQLALASATSMASTTLSPCGTSQTTAQATSLGSLSAFPLTKATFLGPSPAAAFSFAYEDSTGSTASGFTASVNRFSTVGNVVLDQAKNNGRTCQQAPCNQIYYAPGQAYMG